MKINEYNSWIIDFYKKRNWYQYDPFIRVGFLTEEVGELSRAIRGVEIGRDRPDESRQRIKHYYKENLMEELGDVFDNVLILADKYEICSLEDIMSHHQAKLEERFKGE
jgi:NTP pyrophosphatase (non-canonical NTP hydrolase)